MVQSRQSFLPCLLLHDLIRKIILARISVDTLLSLVFSYLVHKKCTAGRGWGTTGMGLTFPTVRNPFRSNAQGQISGSIEGGGGINKGEKTKLGNQFKR